MTPDSFQGDVVIVVEPEPAPPLRELDLFGFASLLVRSLPFIVGCGIVSFAVMAVVMLHAKPRYSSTAVMIVPQGNITSSTLESQLSINTLDLLGGGYELYADIIQSRTVADRLIHDFDLKKVYGTDKDENAEAALGSLTKVQTQREGVIRVTVQDTNPQRAADLANDYLHQLDLLNSRLVLTTISAQRLYLEHELINEKNALADAEVALKEVQEQSSGLTPEAEATAGFNALVNTRAQLHADQIKLDSLLTGATDANPEVVRLRAEISGLASQLASLQTGADTTENGVPTSKVPEKTLIFTRRLREVKFHETLFDLLEKQYESAKQQEAKTPSIVQVLDPAVPAFHKSWPPRTYYCVLAAIGGTVAGIFMVCFWAFIMAYVRNPRNAAKLQQLKTIYRKQT
jgi:tyrosine-protein kinase Etk/Wzc